MAHFIAIYRKKGSSSREEREVRFQTDGGDPSRDELAKKAAKDEVFVGVFPNYRAENGLEDENGVPNQFGPK